MDNFGFISKKKVATEIAKVYNGHNNSQCSKERFLKDCEVQSALNLLCKRLNIKPMHLNKIGGGTGEMLHYEEPETDWSKVEVDTPILVKHRLDGEWEKRHFVKYENGDVYAWDNGRTSWTENDVSAWKYAKLAESNER